MGRRVSSRLAEWYGKCEFGGNYASNLVAESEAEQHGCQEVLFLDNDGYVQEAGTMNILSINLSKRACYSKPGNNSRRSDTSEYSFACI